MIRYRARYVVPITSNPIEHGVVAVRDGRISYVGDRAGAPTAGGRDVDLGDVLLVPGLVNVHTHLELTAMRGFLEDLDFRSWILRLTTAKRAVLTREMLLDAAREGIAEGLRAGITTYADTCDSGVAIEAMRERGVRGIMYQELFGPDPLQCERSMAELRAKIDAMRSLETPLVRLGVSPHAPYTVSDALYAEATKYARQNSLPLAVHIAEGELESRLVTEGAGAFADGLRARGIEIAPRAHSPIALLDAAGMLELRPLLIHCVRIDDGDIARIAETHCGVAHCPVSNAKLGHGIAPLVELLAAGVDVGLGSDSMASNNRMDLLEEARVSVLAQRARLGLPDAIGASRALELATIGGARALGMSDRIGSLEVGKAADLAAFDVAGSLPIHGVAAAAVFALAGSQARFVAVDGRVLVRDGQLVDDDPSCAARVQEMAGHLARWRASAGSSAPVPASPTR